MVAALNQRNPLSKCSASCCTSCLEIGFVSTCMRLTTAIYAMHVHTSSNRPITYGVWDHDFPVGVILFLVFHRRWHWNQSIIMLGLRRT